MYFFVILNLFQYSLYKQLLFLNNLLKMSYNSTAKHYKISQIPSSHYKQYYGTSSYYPTIEPVKYSHKKHKTTSINHLSTNQSNYRQYCQLDEYLLNREHKNRKKIKSLKKEIDLLKNRLGKCQTQIGQVNSQNKFLKKQFQLIKGSTMISHQRGEITKQQLQNPDTIIEEKFYRDLKESNAITKYLPFNPVNDFHRRIKSQPYKELQNYNNLNCSKYTQFQLLTPQTFPQKLHQTTGSFRSEEIQQLTNELGNLVLSEAKCQNIEQKRQIRKTILRLSQKINIIQTNKRSNRFFNQ